MIRSPRIIALLLPLSLLSVGCNDAGGTRTSGTTTTTERRTTTTEHVSDRPQPSGDVRVNAGPNGAVATGGTAGGRDDVNVDVVPGGGVNVDVQGEPIRDRIRERRAARDANLPR